MLNSSIKLEKFIEIPNSVKIYLDKLEIINFIRDFYNKKVLLWNCK